MSDVAVSELRDIFEKRQSCIMPMPDREKPGKLPPKPIVGLKPAVAAKPAGKVPPRLEKVLSPSEEAPEIPARNEGNVAKRLGSVKSPLFPDGPQINLQDIRQNLKKLNHVERKSVSALTANFECKNESAQVKTTPPFKKLRNIDENKNGGEENKNVASNDSSKVIDSSAEDADVCSPLRTPPPPKTKPKPVPPSRKDSLSHEEADEIIEINNIKYKKCHLPASLGDAPEKPAKPPNAVLSRTNSAHVQRRLPSLPPGGRSNQAVSLIEPTPESEEEEEVYDDNVEPPPDVPQRPSERTRMLPSEPEEEETYDDVGNEPEDGIVEEDIYEEFEGDRSEIYDDTDPAMPQESAEDKEKRLKEEKERKAKEEKERKEREKQEREEKKKKEKEEKERLKKLKEDEKERKKKADEEKKILAKFKLNGNEEPIDTGVVKETCKGGKYELMVSAGEQLFIIRKTDTPAGKWLVKNKDGKYGYVNASIVEDNSNNGIEEDDGDTYDAVGPEIDAEDDEQIYEGFDE